MNKFKYGLLILGLIGGLFSCDDDDDYEYIAKLPIGGFLKQEVTQHADYFTQDVEKVAVPVKMNRMGAGQTVTLKLGITVEPATVSEAVTLVKNEIAVTGSAEITPEVVSIDWSKVPAGTELTAVVSLLENENIDLRTICASFQMKADKAALPVPWCDPAGAGEAMLDEDATASKKFTLALLSMTKPAVQDLIVPFKLETENLVEGTDFKILGEYGHAFFVPAGEKSASIEVEVSGSIFPQPGSELVKLILTKEGKDPTQIFEYDPEWQSTNIKIGRKAAYVMDLDPNAQYNALLAAGEGDKEFTLTIPNVIDRAAEKDITIALSLNQYQAKLGTHFQMTAPYQLTVKQGSRDAQLVLTVLSAAFQSSDDNVELYIELADSSQAGIPANFWTTIVLGRE